MATAARLTLGVRRYQLARPLFRVAGIDLSTRDLAMEVRNTTGAPGSPLFRLNKVDTAAAEGIKVEVATEGGIPVSYLKLRINKATMSDPAKVPYAGDTGDPVRLAFGLVISDGAATIASGGDAQERLYGDLIVYDSAFGSDAAPTDRPASYGAQSYRTDDSSASLTFGDTVVQVSIDGVGELGGLIAQATDAAAAAAATEARIIARTRDIISYSGLPFSTRLLYLAQDDGWTGVYDPSNPATRITSTDANGDLRVSSLADGLGILPAAVQATASLQPLVIDDYYGGSGGKGMAGMTRQMGGAAALTTPSFPSAHRTGSFFLMMVADYELTIPAGANRALIDGAAVSSEPYRRSIYTVAGSDGWSTKNAAATITATGTLNYRPRVVAVKQDASGQTLYLDNLAVATGAAAGDGISSLTLLNNYDGTRSWLGGLGPLLVYHGDITDAKRTAMHALLRSSIEKSRALLNTWVGGD